MTSSEHAPYPRQFGWTLRSIRWARYLALGILVAALGLIVAARLAQGVDRVLDVQFAEYGESIVYGQALRVAKGEALYHPLDRPPYSVTAYTPLFYLTAAAIQKFVGPGFVWGRLLSFSSGLVAAGLVASLTARGAGSRWPAMLAGLLFLAFGFGTSVPWFSLYRVDVLGVAFSVAAIFVLSGGTDSRRIVVAGLLAALALMSKQSFIAADVAGALWLLSIDRRKTALYVLPTIAFVGGSVVWFELRDGGFLANVVFANANPTMLEQFLLLAPLLVERQLVPVVITVIYLLTVRPWTANIGRLLVLYWAASAITLVGLAKLGAADNYWIEFAGSTAVLAALGLWHFCQQRETVRAAFAGFGLIALFAFPFAGAPPFSGPEVPAGFPDRLKSASLRTSDEFQQLIERVKDEPGDVLADPLDVLDLAGRSVLLEPFIFSILTQRGQWDPQPVVQRICLGQVKLVVLAYSLEYGARFAPLGYSWWPESVISAIQERMLPAGTQADRYIYIQRPTGETDPTRTMTCPSR